MRQLSMLAADPTDDYGRVIEDLERELAAERAAAALVDAALARILGSAMTPGSAAQRVAGARVLAEVVERTRSRCRALERGNDVLRRDLLEAAELLARSSDADARAFAERLQDQHYAPREVP